MLYKNKLKLVNKIRLDHCSFLAFVTETCLLEVDIWAFLRKKQTEFYYKIKFDKKQTCLTFLINGLGLINIYILISRDTKELLLRILFDQIYKIMTRNKLYFFKVKSLTER